MVGVLLRERSKRNGFQVSIVHGSIELLTGTGRSAPPGNKAVVQIIQLGCRQVTKSTGHSLVAHVARLCHTATLVVPFFFVPTRTFDQSAGWLFCFCLKTRQKFESGFKRPAETFRSSKLVSHALHPELFHMLEGHGRGGWCTRVTWNTEQAAQRVAARAPSRPGPHATRMTIFITTTSPFPFSRGANGLNS